MATVWLYSESYMKRVERALLGNNNGFKFNPYEDEVILPYEDEVILDNRRFVPQYVHLSSWMLHGTDKETTTQGYDDLGKHHETASLAKWQFYGKIGNLVGIKHIFMMSKGDDCGADLATNHKPQVILDTGAQVNVTGDEDIFKAVAYDPEGFGLKAANGNKLRSYMCGYLSHDKFHINCLYFSKDLGPRTIISGPELDVLGYSLKFEEGTCEVRDRETGFLVGEGRLVDNKYLMDYLKIPLDRVPVQVPNVENVPLPDGPVRPLSVLTAVWRAIRTLLRRFSGPLSKQAIEEAPRRPPV